MISTEMCSYLRSAFILALLLAIVQCHMNDDSSDNNSKNELPSGLGRLIFKQMRFRELPELGEPKEDSYGPWEDRTEEQNLEVGKRDRQRLVKDLADLLTSMREQETGSTLRMPSLRFG